MHGNFDRADKTYDWFLITEEHYVDFLGRPETVQVPQMLATLMKKKNFLFLGYGLKDWNVRVMLRKLAHNARRRDQGRLLGDCEGSNRAGERNLAGRPTGYA